MDVLLPEEKAFVISQELLPIRISEDETHETIVANNYHSLGDIHGYHSIHRLLCFHEKDLMYIWFHHLDIENFSEIDEINARSNEIIPLLEQGFFAFDLDVRYINNLMGYGLYTKCKLKAEEYLGEYVGLVSNFQQSSISDEGNVHNTSDYALYYPVCGGGYHIDAREYGNILRFMNHSDNPNAKFCCVILNKLAHVIVMTMREIEVNEQITVNYSSNYWLTRKLKPLN